MPQAVPYDTIDDVVVKDFDRLMRETAKDRGHDVTIQQPFHCHDSSYSEVMDEVRQKTQKGLEFYRMMVKQLPWYVFSNEPSGIR